MLEVIASTRSDMSPALFKALARYRYEVFVKDLGWALPCAEGLEVDAFDRPDTVYVLARDSRQEIVGCARLIPTDRPFLLGEVFPQFLLGEVFPQLMGDIPLPSSSTVWELSRFASGHLLSRRAHRAWHDTIWLMSRADPWRTSVDCIQRAGKRAPAQAHGGQHSQDCGAADGR